MKNEKPSLKSLDNDTRSLKFVVVKMRESLDIMEEILKKQELSITSLNMSFEILSRTIMEIGEIDKDRFMAEVTKQTELLIKQLEEFKATEEKIKEELS